MESPVSWVNRANPVVDFQEKRVVFLEASQERQGHQVMTESLESRVESPVENQEENQEESPVVSRVVSQESQAAANPVAAPLLGDIFHQDTSIERAVVLVEHLVHLEETVERQVHLEETVERQVHLEETVERQVHLAGKVGRQGRWEIEAILDFPVEKVERPDHQAVVPLQVDNFRQDTLADQVVCLVGTESRDHQAAVPLLVDIFRQGTLAAQVVRLVETGHQDCRVSEGSRAHRPVASWEEIQEDLEGLALPDGRADN